MWSNVKVLFVVYLLQVSTKRAQQWCHSKNEVSLYFVHGI